MTVKHHKLFFTWLGYATTRISGPAGTVVYTDPGRYGTLTGDWEERFGGVSHPTGPPYVAQDGNVVLVTHDHHYDDDGVRRVASDDATVIVYEGVSADGVQENSGRKVVEPEDLPYDVRRVSYHDNIKLNDIEIDVIPAYNFEDGRNLRDNGVPIHPEGFGCGYRFTLDDTSCFWTGDTDVLDIHSTLDVSLFIPTIAQSITMNQDEAVELASEISPDLVVPIHYNTFPALEADSRRFAADVASRSIPVALDED